MFNIEGRPKDSIFFHKSASILEDMILKGKYQGALSRESLLLLSLEKALELNSTLLKASFTQILDMYYTEMEHKELPIPEHLKLENVKEYIKQYEERGGGTQFVSVDDLFGSDESESMMMTMR